MKFTSLIIILFHLTFTSPVKGSDTLVNRYREYFLRTNVPQPELVNNWTNTLNAKGQWPDINYNDHELAGWKIPNHLVRVREMALAWASPQSSQYGNESLFKKINSSLDHWIKARYKSANWWHNEIGVPRIMRDIIILAGRNLDKQRLKQSLEVMSQLVVHDDYVGGNLVWGADLGLHYGALTGDEKLVRRCRDLIIKEIMITTGEGIQPDYSFHQHSKRLQMYQYGKAFAGESIRVAWQLRETPLAFPKEKIDILTDFILEGWQWMARGVHTVPGTMDRSASRKGELKSPDIRYLIPFLVEVQPERSSDLQKMAAIQNGSGSLVGYRNYPYSDFTVFHRPEFSFFLKTISQRTESTESINRENLKGKLLHSGDSYLVSTGREYYDLMSVWDWTKLPGVTSFKRADLIVRKAFVGSVSDSIDGFSAMDYVLKDKTNKQVLSARKFWACHQDMVVGLIANLEAANISEGIYTALNQCRWEGDVTVNSTNNVLAAGLNSLSNVKWIHHSGFAYIPLQPAVFDVDIREVSGSWTSINASETTVPVKEKVFTPVMFHDAEKRRSAGYVLARCKTPGDAKRLAAKPNWKVLRNDNNCQAVSFKGGVVMASFYSASKLELTKRSGIQVDQPCLIMLKNNNIYASDPTHKGITVTITFNNKVVSVALPKDGFTKMIRNGGTI